MRTSPLSVAQNYCGFLHFHIVRRGHIDFVKTCLVMLKAPKGTIQQVIAIRIRSWKYVSCCPVPCGSPGTSVSR
jgi:hypothetical protein